MKRVFIIHGYGGRPNGGWRPWLMAELAKTRTYAFSLAMPTPDTPIHTEWVEEIARCVKRDGGSGLYLVGHSLGVAAILRYLERSDAPNIDGAVLIAGPSGPTSNTHTKSFFASPFDYEVIRPKIGKCVIIHGSNDDLVPIAHAERLSKGLDAPLVIVKGGGHFNSSSGSYALPEARDALAEMMGEI